MFVMERPGSSTLQGVLNPLKAPGEFLHGPSVRIW
jgi:hypothetical protein